MSEAPECVVCGEREFEVSGGLYFCTNCQTQSQDLRQEEEKEIEVGTNLRDLRIRTTKQKVQSLKSEIEFSQHGRPWRTQEGFTVVIREQIQALVNMGADPQIQDVVLRIWMLYLSKIDVAFKSLVPKQDKVFSEIKQERDEQLLTLDNARVTANRWYNTMKRSRGGALTSQEAKRKQEKEELEKRLGTEEFYEEDNPFAEMDYGVHMNMSSVTNKKHEREVRVKDIKFTFVMQPYWLTVPRCTAFAYIGLLYTHNLTIPADYIRWIYSGKVPYEGISSRFPPDMKFFSSDAKIFAKERKRITAETLRNEASKLMKFLNLEEIRQPALQLFCSRFILQLNLPNDLHGFVASLLHRRPLVLRAFQKTKQKLLVETDIIAMATVVIVLKLIFGLNGEKEIKLSQYARLVNNRDIFERPLFELDTWLRFSHKTKKSGGNVLTENVKDMKKVTDVPEFLRSYRDAFGEEKMRSKHIKVKTKDENARRDLARSLRELDSNSKTGWPGNSMENSMAGGNEEILHTDDGVMSNDSMTSQEEAHLLEDSAVAFRPLHDIGDYANHEKRNAPSEGLGNRLNERSHIGNDKSTQSVTNKTNEQSGKDSKQPCLESLFDFSHSFVGFALGKDPAKELCRKPMHQSDDSDMDQSNSTDSASKFPRKKQTVPRINPTVTKPSYWLCSRHKDTKPKCYVSVLSLGSQLILCSEERLHEMILLMEHVFIVGEANLHSVNSSDRIRSRNFFEKYFDPTDF